MKTYIVLLRGVMPTGKNKVPMAQLRTILSEAGFENVRTYIQSGNALVDTKLSAKEIEMKVHELIKQHMGAHISVVVRTGNQLQKVLEANPFNDGFDPSRVFYVLFKNRPNPIKVDELCTLDFGKEKMFIGTDEAYLYLPENAARSKLSNLFLERKLEITATTRNLNTMKKLVELSRDSVKN
ncbi:MAG: DUF1697 domain-containing protein [Salinivirgaceae bacterium]